MYYLSFQRHHEKSEVYNLDDEEDELTHYGQSLSNIDNYDDAGLKLTDDEDDISGTFSSHFISKQLRLYVMSLWLINPSSQN